METNALTPETLGLFGIGLVAMLAALNLVTFSVFAVDRSREATGRAPLPEVLLLALAALGGWPGAKLAQMVLRFQGQTAQFRSLLNLVALPLVAVAGLVIYEEVDLWALEGRVMSWVGEVTGTGPEVAAARDAAALEAPSGSDSDDATGAASKTDAPAAPTLPRRIGPGSDGKAGKVGKRISAKTATLDP